MSEMKYEFGIVAELLNPIDSEEERDDIMDEINDNPSIAIENHINDEGTLIYINLKSKECAEDLGLIMVKKVKCKHLINFALPIKPKTARYFFNGWYNGCDNPLDTMSLEEFRNRKI